MEKTYCGACRGERGCVACNIAAKSAVYTGLTEFQKETEGRENGTGYHALLPEELQKEAHPNADEMQLLLAADIGTTTLAFVCADAKGTVLASYGAGNPQRKTAADVIGRIDAALRGKREVLTNEIREALAKGFLFVLERTLLLLRDKGIETEKIGFRIAMAGNTTMQHLTLGYPVEGLAKAPFTPDTLDGEERFFGDLFRETTCYGDFPEGIKKATVKLFPCFSAFVGGDVAAGVYALFPEAVSHAGEALSVEKSPESHSTGEACGLLLDLGTNGEIILATGNGLYGTAAAMGSAFEGGHFAYASELFRRIAAARKEQVLDDTGLLAEPYFTEGYRGVTQEDIREFQLAKGALRAGISLLCKRGGVELSQIGQIYVAGGVGKFCSTEDFFGAGLLPKEFFGKVTVVGNSCIGGLLSYLKNEETMIYCKGEMINLAEDPGFEEAYYHFMNFE